MTKEQASASGSLKDWNKTVKNLEIALKCAKRNRRKAFWRLVLSWKFNVIKA